MCYQCLQSLNVLKSKKAKSYESSNKINYIFIDLRMSLDLNDDKIYENIDNKTGFIPKTIILDQSELSSENVSITVNNFSSQI